MRKYTIKGKEHTVYESGDVIPDYVKYRSDWQEARIGDWVKADDGCIIQVLRRKKIGNFTTIGTCTGTYKATYDMDTVRRKNIYNLTGTEFRTVSKNRKVCTANERMFAKRVAEGWDIVDAYLDVFPAKSVPYAKKRASFLIKTERIDTLMREELKDTFGKHSIDLDYLIGIAKNVTDSAKNDADRLRALTMLWDAYGVIEKQKITNVTGIFQGLSQEQLDSAQRPELPENV